MPSKRMSIRRTCIIAATSFAACLLVVLLRFLYLEDVWQNINVINFIVAWIPFVLSVLLAFIPDKEMKLGTRIKWRIAVVVCGLGYSVVLWHQQTLTAALATSDQTGLVTEAVKSANKHSDQQIAEVRSDVKGVKTDVQAVKDAIAQSTSTLSKSLGEVKLPTTEKAGYSASFWPVKLAEWPVREKSLPLTKGVVTLDFTFRIENHMAKQTKLWLRLCGDCKYAKEPSGFQNLASQSGGGEPTERMLTVGDFLPNIAWTPITVDVIPPPGVTSFLVGVTLGCENCDPIDPDRQQALTVHIQP